jgi:hypothetical protein
VDVSQSVDEPVVHLRPRRDLLLLLVLEVVVFVTLARVPFDGSRISVVIVGCCVVLWAVPVLCVFVSKVALTEDTLFVEGAMHGWTIPWTEVASVRRDRAVIVGLHDGREIAVTVTRGASRLAAQVEGEIRARLYFGYLPMINVIVLRTVAG